MAFLLLANNHQHNFYLSTTTSNTMTVSTDRSTTVPWDLRCPPLWLIFIWRKWKGKHWAHTKEQHQAIGSDRWTRPGSRLKLKKWRFFVFFLNGAHQLRGQQQQVHKGGCERPQTFWFWTVRCTLKRMEVFTVRVTGNPHTQTSTCFSHHPLEHKLAIFRILHHRAESVPIKAEGTDNWTKQHW